MPDNGSNPLTADPVESWFTQARSQGDTSFPDQLGRVVLGLGQGTYDLAKNIISMPHDVMTRRYAPGSLEAPVAQYGIDLATAGLIPELGGPEFDPNRLNLFSGWHGTPHKYAEAADNPLGEFLNEKIGTGEGAQVRGWGHYIAGAEETGGTYRKSLSQGPTVVHFNDEPIFSADRTGEEGTEFHDAYNKLPQEGQDAMDALNTNIGRGRTDPVGEALNQLEDSQENKRLFAEAEEDGDNHAAAERYRNEAAAHGAAFDWLRHNETKIRVEDPGYLLNVSVRPEKHELLDLDNTILDMNPAMQEKLSNLGFETPDPEHVDNMGQLKYLEQRFYDNLHNFSPEKIQTLIDDPNELASRNRLAALRGNDPVDIDELREYQGLDKWLDSFSGTGESPRTYNPTGEEIYWELAQNRGPRGASEFLAKNGIPGSRFLDQGSRARGFGTSNYVIFDPKDIWITARNGMRLFPVDHNPWTQTVTPVDENPFEEAK